MSARIDIRASIYGLSQLATHLPKRSHQFGDAPKNAGRTLNHLATCLSRGLNDEQGREIAVTMGPLNLSGLEIAVVASRTNDSRDLGTGTQPSSPSHPSSSHIRPLSSIAQDAETPINESEDRQLVELTIPAPDDIDNAVLREKIETLMTDCIATEPFITFVHNSFTLLRTAAAYIRREPNSIAATKSKVFRFFIFSCWPKIRHRVQSFSESYPWDDLKAWQPTSVEISATNPSKVLLLHSTVSHALSLTKVPSSDANLFEFSGSNAVLWWQGLLKLVRCLQDCLVDPSPQDPGLLSAFSIATHSLLGSIPLEFWSFASLGKLLERCREESTAPPAVSSDQPGPGGDDDDSVQYILSPDKCLPRDAHPECVTFHRAIEALCAWTTGPNHLLNGRFMRTSIPLTVYIADLPRSPIPSVTANQLLEHWRSRRDWAEITALPSLVASICVEDPQRLSGASHCEAGLMASLLLCHNLSDEPPALSGGYSQVEREAVPIGAAKKCCPICRMLAELLLERGVNVELPGRHDHYHPWVAPHWLPVSILEALEDRLLDTVDAMLAFAKPHATRTSSPGSEDGDWVTADHEYAKTILDELNELRGRNL